MEVIKVICWTYVLLVIIMSFYYIVFKVGKDFKSWQELKKIINSETEINEEDEFKWRLVFFLEGIYNAFASLFVLLIVLFTGLFALLIALLYN